MARKKLKALVITLSERMQRIEDIKSIRIKSSDYNLLIMEDFMPTIGEIIAGHVEIINDVDSFTFSEVNGYYIVNRNEFKLIIKGG